MYLTLVLQWVALYGGESSMEPLGGAALLEEVCQLEWILRVTVSPRFQFSLPVSCVRLRLEL